MDDKSICAVEGCDKPVRSKGWCNSHYLRWYNHGDPTKGGTPFGALEAFCDQAILHEDKECCLPWPFGRTAGGYGVVSWKGKRTTAPRAICERVYGPPPSAGMVVAHSCGRGHEGCVNPHHLRWATCKENSEEMVQHGTSPKGEKCGHSKLTEKQVRAILAARGRESLGVLAERFGVTKSAICDIHRGRTWAYLNDQMERDKPPSVG